MGSIIIKKITVYIAAALFSISMFGQNNTSASIEFNKMVHDFGDILLTSGRQSYTFTFKNICQQPVVIQTVISSCGCTTPVWTRSPVQPGESGKIDVTFLNDQGPYPFDKSLTVYVTGSSRPIILRIKGVVHAKKKSLKQLFPEVFSQMAMKKSPIDLGQVFQGTVTREAHEVVNTSSSPIEVLFTEVSKGLSLSISPSVIAPGGRGELIISIDTKIEKNWGRTTYSAVPVINGKKNSRKLIIQASIREDFTNLSNEEIDQSSLPMSSKSSYNFGTISSGKIIETSFDIKNLGRKDLIIHKIDANETGVNTKFPPKIAPGSAGKISISINTSSQFGEKIYILTLITNSPSRPMVNLLVTGTITK